MNGKSRSGRCQLCGRETTLTFHHLVPRKVHRRNRFRKHLSRETLQQGIAICRPCHSGLHRLHDEMTLATRLNTLAALRQDPALSRHVDWVRKQRVGLPDD
jgi:5-methylcytosine-specific restriction endonuclease McrA